MSPRSFIKMHGLGNDFVVVDARERPFVPDLDAARRIADRRTGVGCDQLIVVEPSGEADVFMRIRNSDGGEVEACGNGARCVAALVMADLGRDEIRIETLAGILVARAAGPGAISVAMGVPGLEWTEVPLAREMDTLHLELSLRQANQPVLADPVALSIGNPHAVFFVDDVDAIDLANLGPMGEHHPLFLQIQNARGPRAHRKTPRRRGSGGGGSYDCSACNRERTQMIRPNLQVGGSDRGCLLFLGATV